MTMLTEEMIEEWVAQCISDPHRCQGHRTMFLKNPRYLELLGLTVAESSLDPYRPCPSDWTAFQVAYFDNGEVEKKRNRPKIQRCRMRFVGNIKVFTRSDINFGSKAQVAWQANYYLWTADQARQIVRDLLEEKLVTQETVDLMDSATEQPDTSNLRFSIPMLRVGTATRWMNNHLVITGMDGDQPNNAIFVFPDAEPFATTAFADTLADGEALKGNVILQARLARSDKYGTWPTEVVE